MKSDPTHSRDLSFAPIDLNRNAQICVEFRRDSFVASFGDDSRFVEAEYLAWLRSRLHADPSHGVHVWQGGRVVAQLELGADREDGAVGYVDLFYIAPEMRGTSLGDAVAAYADEWFRDRDFERARLRVSQDNARALRYYEKHGWHRVGPDATRPEIVVMEKPID